MMSSLLPRRLVFGLLVVFVCVPGCSGGKPKTKVTGKVLYNGSPVAGEVVFLGEDGKEHTGPISTEGEFILTNAPKGKYKVGVRLPKGALPPATGGGAIAPPTGASVKDAGLVGSGKQPVAPPDKYKDPKSSGLEFEITGSENTYDIPLK